jgi:hypothetical protein
METTMRNQIGVEAGRVSVYLMNHEYFMQDTFATLDDAIARARETCFQVSFHRDGKLLGSWCPIGGLRLERGAR